MEVSSVVYSQTVSKPALIEIFLRPVEELEPPHRLELFTTIHNIIVQQPLNLLATEPPKVKQSILYHAYTTRLQWFDWLELGYGVTLYQHSQGTCARGRGWAVEQVMVIEAIWYGQRRDNTVDAADFDEVENENNSAGSCWGVRRKRGRSLHEATAEEHA